jgi:ATP-dependent Lhr-like helicase
MAADAPRDGSLDLFQPPVAAWFTSELGSPTPAQRLGWPSIARGDSTLVLAPTGSGKTLAAFLWAIDRLMFTPRPSRLDRCRILYVSPLRALAVDVERNLRRPLEGIARLAEAQGVDHVVPTLAVRTGDTPQGERARLARNPADILITTPESLYLLLTSNARDGLASVDTVIVDEIHALVPTKRGAHLALSLERLEARCRRPVQRIGLSATQRPLDEVARFLGGATDPEAPRRVREQPAAGGATVDSPLQLDAFEADAPARYRPVTIVDAREPKALSLRIEVPVEQMARHEPRLPAPGEAPVASIWSSIHPRLVEIIRSHRSTLVFVNNRRLAERIAGALNELAGEVLVRSHHGSIARAQRLEIEEALKAGTLPALVATSSLELGIDMGAIDLVVQIEAPPSVASGLQRIGRAGHHVGAVSDGVIFPKFRADLLACAAAARAMHAGDVECIRYPRSPLDVLAQQVAAMVAMDDWSVTDLVAVVRRAAPFATTNERAVEGVLDMLSGRYPSDEFAGLRPRITWDRTRDRLRAREGTRRVAVVNGGTIPDRGLYGVFLAGSDRGPSRVGELDEEMVFESRVGDTFVLGASTWRIDDITHDRVLVSPAPGQPGRMPFWRGDQAGRPAEFGLAIGRLARELAALPDDGATARLVSAHDLDARAAANLVGYLREQEAVSRVPDDRTLVVERSRDDLGDWRIALLSPFGGRVHAPWAIALSTRARHALGVEVESLWSDDGIVLRLPEAAAPPGPELLVPGADEIDRLLLPQLSSTALFAGKFREAAARSLLLPRRQPGRRTPLWQQRRRAADLLAVASRHGGFPPLLETYRECLHDVFDMPALRSLLRQIARGEIELVTVDTERPSPFAASLLFGYVANFIYEGDAPLAERRAQALSVDQSQLSELLGDAELRDLLDARAIHEVERELQGLDDRYRARHADAVHDLLLRVGDLTRDEIADRAASPGVAACIDDLVAAGRAIRVAIGGAERFAAVEDAVRYRDGLGLELPATVPPSLTRPVADPLGDLLLRYARTHGPFTDEECAARFAIPPGRAREALTRLGGLERVVEGEFRPGGSGREWCGAEVLRRIRRRSLARLRQEVEPVDAPALARFLGDWHGLAHPGTGDEALVDAIEQLQGAPLAASILETEILARRVRGYESARLDALIASGDVVWVGLERIGDRDGRVALYLAAQIAKLRRRTSMEELDSRERLIVDHVRERGASFFAELHAAAGGGYPGETVRSLWDLVWKGLLTNDTFQPLRSHVRPEPKRRRDAGERLEPRPRRVSPPSTEGRWSLVDSRLGADVSMTEHIAALASQFLTRHGVLTRESLGSELVSGGFSLIHPALKAMEERGRLRRGYFVEHLGAMQFALAPALELLRSHRDPPDPPHVLHLAATDPANPYGGIVPWPAAASGEGGRPMRQVGASLVLVDGCPAAYLGRGARQLLVFLPEEEPARSRVGAALAGALLQIARGGAHAGPGMIIGEIDGMSAMDHALAPFLERAGFRKSALGFQARFAGPGAATP